MTAAIANRGFFYTPHIIKAIDDIKIQSNENLIETLEGYKPNDKIRVTFLRDDKLYEADLELISTFNK